MSFDVISPNFYYKIFSVQLVSNSSAQWNFRRNVPFEDILKDFCGEFLLPPFNDRKAIRKECIQTNLRGYEFKIATLTLPEKFTESS